MVAMATPRKSISNLSCSLLSLCKATERKQCADPSACCQEGGRIDLFAKVSSKVSLMNGFRLSQPPEKNKISTVSSLTAFVCLFYFFIFYFFFEIRTLCVSLTVTVMTIQIRLASSSEICLPLPTECWV